MNSNQKGKRGERQWRDELRENGYDARRGQQFAGGDDSPDVICHDLEFFHFEVKAVEKLNLEAAMEQARRDAGHKEPIVAHKRNFKGWLVTMPSTTFFKMLRGDFEVKKKKPCDPDLSKLANVHDPSKCKGQFCVIHNPSNHHMRDWPLHWRDDKGCFERICKHGVGHPDPDDAAYNSSIGNDWISVHGCDGCCRKEE